MILCWPSVCLYFCPPVNENRLLVENLERWWAEEKLHALIGVDAEGYSKLQLVALLLYVYLQPSSPSVNFAFSNWNRCKFYCPGGQHDLTQVKVYDT